MLIGKTARKETTVIAPPAKAYTLRAILLGSLAEGTSEVINPLLAADQLALIDSLEKLGVEISRLEDRLVIKGAAGRFQPRAETLNLGESGVGMNLLLAATSLAGKAVILTGKEGLVRRPVQELVSGLRQLGCQLDYLDQEGFPPVRNAGQGIPGGLTRMSGRKTSQYFSSIAVSAPYAAEPVVLECTDELSEKPYYDISLEMMARFGVEVQREGCRITRIPNNRRYVAVSLAVEGDYSSASFFFTIAALCGSRVTVQGLNPASLQGDRKIVELLAAMGCRVEHADDAITLTGCPLQAIEADMADVPDLVPPVAVAGAFAGGTTILRRVGHLRYKECNRLEAVVINLGNMGVKAHYDEDALYVEGNPAAHGTVIDTFNDHRIAMSFAAAGMRCGDMAIGDEKCVGKSFPDFWVRLKEFY